MGAGGVRPRQPRQGSLGPGRAVCQRGARPARDDRPADRRRLSVSVTAPAGFVAGAATAAATAIMTTDTKMKQTKVDGEGFVVGGMGKGAAMLAPDMATMLAVLTTDAAVDASALARMLRDGMARSFNAVSIDGCTSTNDTVLVLASGSAGPTDEGALAEALHGACTDLATQMVADAEGATRVVRVAVRGAADDADARRAARRVADR